VKDRVAFFGKKEPRKGTKKEKGGERRKEAGRKPSFVLRSTTQKNRIKALAVSSSLLRGRRERGEEESLRRRCIFGTSKRVLSELLSPRTARRQALRAGLAGTEKKKKKGRDGQGRKWMPPRAQGGDVGLLVEREKSPPRHQRKKAGKPRFIQSRREEEEKRLEMAF